MPVEVIQKFFDAFSRLPQTVVAKFVVPDSVKVPPNVKLMRWLPQNDILGHPRTKLFITHCGSNGQLEAVYHGVPMLGMPLYAEQSWNCERAVRKGFGLEVNILDFTANQFYDSIVKILPENSTYRAAVRQMSAILRSYPMNGRQTAAFWIDHVIKFGGKHLRSLSINQPWYTFLMLDILLFLLLVVGLITSCCIFCLRLLSRKCQRHHNTGLATGLADHSKKTE
jgi:glucuronosyltransferase